MRTVQNYFRTYLYFLSVKQGTKEALSVSVQRTAFGTSDQVNTLTSKLPCERSTTANVSGFTFIGVQGYSGKADATARAPASFVQSEIPTKNS